MKLVGLVGRLRWSIAIFQKSFASVSLAAKPLYVQGNCAISVSVVHILLQLCRKSRNLRSGRACHALALLLGLKGDTLTSNMLIAMYSRCGFVASAHQVFERMPKPSLISWNSMIDAYIKHGDDDIAVVLFLEAIRLGFSFSEYTLSSILCACEGSGGVFLCRQFHSLAIKSAMEGNSFVGTELLDVYAKNGVIHDAIHVFEEMEEKNDVTWSSMIAGLLQNDMHEEALSLFARAHVLGLEFFEFSLSSAISACAAMAALAEGSQLHAAVIKTGLSSNLYISSSLIDMYSRCGNVKEAYDVFSTAETMNLVLWNTMMSGLAKHSRSLEVLILFEKLQQAGLSPDEVTYVSVLSACSHTGLVSMAESHFSSMNTRNSCHYSCMVDVLGRAGLTQEAYEMMKKMPFVPTAPMWGSLLSSCRTYGDVKLGRIAAEKLIELEPENAGNHILLCHMYAASKQWEQAATTWKFLHEHEVRKETGESWIKIRDEVHVFCAGERSHSSIRDVLRELKILQEGMKKARSELLLSQIL